MSEFILYRGNRNYSSWSMRGWLALRQTGTDFEEVAFHLGAPDYTQAIGVHSPSAKVPALRHGDRVIWDSLAITEYLAEQFPAAGIWPADPAARATARAVVAEMHSGFMALRTHMPFNVRRASPGAGRGEGVAADLERVQAIWSSCLAGSTDGPYLFGAWSAADMFYAPVVIRFRSFGVALDNTCAEYAKAVREHSDVAEWTAAALQETERMPGYDG